MSQNESKDHVVSYGTYILVWFGLIVLTGLTVAISGTNLESLSVIIMILIALTKSLLVLLIFMHLKYEALLFKIMVLVVIVALTIFIAFTFLDVSYR